MDSEELRFVGDFGPFLYESNSIAADGKGIAFSKFIGSDEICGGASDGSQQRDPFRLCGRIQ